MCTEKLYLAVADLEGTATVVEVINMGEELAVRLDRTLFHPQGGGQKADRGTIGGVPVREVRHAEDGKVDHFVAGWSYEVGDQVGLLIDANSRREACRWHSAGHLIADCAVALDPKLRPLRGHHWPNEGRVEFAGDVVGLGAFTEKLSLMLTAAINDDIPFTVVGNPYINRALQIGDRVPVPCGGTHVNSAEALGGLAIRKVQQKQGVLRIGYGF